MCSKPTRSSARKRRNTKKSKPAARKTRSLKQDLSVNSPESAESTQQLNLFPLHPEQEEDHDVDYLFDTTDTTSATLNGLIWSNSTTSIGASSEEDSRCPSLTYAYSEEVTTTTTTTSSLLERSALRGGNKERDLSEEKWVCYQEVTSCVPESFNKVKTESEGGFFLSLKLDYDHILNAWSDKGPLYIDGAGPGPGGGFGGKGRGCQIVPDVLDDDDARRLDVNNVFFDVPLLRVCDDGSSGMEGEVWKLGPREARVLRYKEKRRKRLFSKRIRYEVRKLNAEKRPRMKGRFVKRS